MDWTRLTRLWAWPGRNRTMRTRWEYIGRSARDAAFMMDGSTGEADLWAHGARMARIFREALDIGPSDRVLEVGCGVGRVTRELAASTGPYTAADISSTLLRRARSRTRHLPNVSLMRLPDPDAPTGPPTPTDALTGLPDAGFDCLICHLVLLHVPEPQVRRLLAGFARVLAPHGRAYLDLWNASHPDSAALAAREAADPRLSRQPHRSRFFTGPQLRAWLTAAGLTPAWTCADSHLLQAVALRADAPADLQAAAADQAAATPDLIPRGHLRFTDDI